MLRNILLAAVAATAFAAPVAQAGTTFWGGTEGSTVIGPTLGTAIGSLTAPSTIVFSDILGLNTTNSPIATTDDWTFSLPVGMTVGASVTGQQISFSNFSISGTLDSIELFSGTPGSGSPIIAGTSVGSFSSALANTVLNAGSYFLEVKAKLGAGPATVGGYTGTLVATGLVPEAETWAMLAAGLAFVAYNMRRRFG